MNKYNIKVGDYVETWDGAIDVVEEVANNAFVYRITYLIQTIISKVRNIGV